jgi:hypothetical protein
MAEKNQNIHLFIIQEAYAKAKAKPTFSTTTCALDSIFGAEYKKRF